MRPLMLLTAVFAVVSVQAQSPIARGEWVRVSPASSPSETRTTLPLRIVGIPGDRIAVANSVVLVNDAVLTGFSPEFLTRVGQNPRIPSVVPAGHYVVAGERRTGQDISEYWGLHPGGELEIIR